MINKKIIIAITGASGAIYADLLLNRLFQIKDQFETCAVVMSENARSVWNYELKKNIDTCIPFKIYDNSDFYAPFASGSSNFNTMIICPCSMGTLGRIASGTSSDLISRTADVMLKERKKLILVSREMPLNLIHINNMKIITEAGGIICPAAPSFYSCPETTEEILSTVIEKILNLADFEINSFRWG
ncbi:MAG: UbiX family flavin prenyltransferase [Bacteroidetes bacterium]|nr:UbiX family flavin prenyltransferase [Bacteroidota bacterium]